MIRRIDFGFAEWGEFGKNRTTITAFAASIGHREGNPLEIHPGEKCNIVIVRKDELERLEEKLTSRRIK